MRYIIILIVMLSILSTLTYTYIVVAEYCTIIVKATYLLHNGTTISISPGETDSINVDGYVIPLHYNDTLLEKAVKTSITEFIRDTGCCIIRYRNVRLITIRYGDIYIDLYYNETNKLLICAATEDYDLAILTDYETTTTPCSTSTTTTTTTAQSTTTTPTTTTSTTTSSEPETVENTWYTTPIIIIIAVIAFLTYYKLRHR